MRILIVERYNFISSDCICHIVGFSKNGSIGQVIQPSVNKCTRVFKDVVSSIWYLLVVKVDFEVVKIIHQIKESDLGVMSSCTTAIRSPYGHGYAMARYHVKQTSWGMAIQ